MITLLAQCSLGIKFTGKLHSKKGDNVKLICDCGFNVNEKFTRTYFLTDSKDFKCRQLKVGYCYECLSSIAILKEKRITDDKVFTEIIKGVKVLRFLKKEKNNIGHVRYGQSQKVKDTWTFGINKEVKNKKGQIVEIRQYSSDFFGNKELVKKIGKRI